MTLRKRLDKVIDNLRTVNSPLRRTILISVLSMLLIICIPVFSVINELYIVSSSINIIGGKQNISDEDLEQYRRDDTDSSLSNSDINVIEDANAQIMAFMEANKEPIPAGEYGIINILLIGCDSNSYEGYLRSDSMIILSIDAERNSVKLVSLMRDMRVLVGKHYDKLNAAFAYDSSGQLLLDTIEKNFLIHIDDFVCINYRAFKDAVDTLGGVTVTVDEGDIAAINKCISDETHHITHAGEQLLNGAQTLGFCQMRKVGTDIARTARQRIVMTELLKMAKDMSLSEMNDLIEATLPNIKTNMTQGEIFYLALKAASLKDFSIEQMRIPIDHSWEDLIVDERWYISFNHQKNVDALHKLIFGEAEAAAKAAENAAKASAVSSADSPSKSDK